MCFKWEFELRMPKGPSSPNVPSFFPLLPYIPCHSSYSMGRPVQRARNEERKGRRKYVLCLWTVLSSRSQKKQCRLLPITNKSIGISANAKISSCVGTGVNALMYVGNMTRNNRGTSKQSQTETKAKRANAENAGSVPPPSEPLFGGCDFVISGRVFLLVLVALGTSIGFNIVLVCQLRNLGGLHRSAMEVAGECSRENENGDAYTMKYIWTAEGWLMKIEEVLDEYEDWSIVANAEDADILWVRHHEEVPWDTLRADQYVNRIRDEPTWTTKGSMTTKLSKYIAEHPDSKIKIPLSYPLYVPEVCRSFKEKLVNLLQDPQDSSIWIRKHTHLSQGEGAAVLNTPDLLKDLDCQREVQYGPEAGREFFGNIVQEYIKNPLLLDGCKSEIRFYWMAISGQRNPNNPNAEWLILMYKEGTVRKTASKYSLENLHDSLTHLTNTYQQEEAGFK
eukprot:g31615.t1